MVRQDAFRGGGGVPYKDIPANQREYMYVEVSSIEVSSVAQYTIIGAPGAGKTIVVWGFSMDNSSPSTYLAGSFFKGGISGDTIGHTGASRMGTSFVEFPIPSKVGENLPVVLDVLVSSGIVNTSYATIYYTVVDV